MAKHNETFSCKVKLWGQDVGYLADHRGDITFAYDKAFLSSNYEISPIHVPRREGVFTHANDGETFQKLLGVYADSLPDYYGRQVVKAYFQAKYGRADKFVSPIQQLAYIGSRGLGALTYEPQDQPNANAEESLEIAYLVEQARKFLEGNFEVDATAIITSIMQSNSVAGGARPKALIGWDRVNNSIIAGVPPLPHGYEHWLIKFDATTGASEPFGRAEYVYSRIARECGIPMSETMLVRERGNAHFMTKRFDRVGETNESLHMHSLCGITHVDYKIKQALDYEDLFAVVQRVTKDQRQVADAFRRMVFNVVGRNHDDHTKNFAFLMDKQGQWTLSPAYDLSYANNPKSEWVAQHLTTINGQSMNPTRKDMLRLAKAFDIKHANDVMDEVEEAFSRWPKYAREEGIDNAFIDHVASNLRISEAVRVRVERSLNVTDIGSYRDVVLSPERHVRFLRELETLASRDTSGDANTLWAKIEVGGVPFSLSDYCFELETISALWQWNDVDVKLRCEFLERHQWLKESAFQCDLTPFIEHFGEVKEALSGVSDSANDSDFEIA